MSKRVLICSVYPEHADNIFSGKKRFEIRRTEPKVQKGDTVLIYATQPRQLYIGTFSVKHVLSGSKSTLWNQVKEAVCITRKSMFDYLEDEDCCYAIEVSSPKIFEFPVHWRDAVQSGYPQLYPPQGFRYTTDSQLNSFINEFNCEGGRSNNLAMESKMSR